MNLRILKKLSKRAAPLLPLLGENRKVFKCDEGGDIGFYIMDRKHWERMCVHHGGASCQSRPTLKYKVRRGTHWIVMWAPHDAWPGTMMVGAMSGYYEPEWSEQTAWEALLDIVWDHFTELEYVTDSTGDAEWPTPTCTRDLSTPTLVLAAAREIINAKAASVTAHGEVK